MKKIIITALIAIVAMTATAQKKAIPTPPANVQRVHAVDDTICNIALKNIENAFNKIVELKATIATLTSKEVGDKVNVQPDLDALAGLARYFDAYKKQYLEDAKTPKK